MALDWEAWELALLEGGGSRPGILCRIDSDPVIRLWAGAVRDLAIPADAVEDVEGAIYQSMGLLTDFPQLSELLNGEAERVVAGLSGAGVTAEMADLATADASSIRSVRVNFGLMMFDANWIKGTPVLWPWEGEADSLTTSWEGGKAGASRKIALSVGSILTGRRRPFNGLNTDLDQQRRSPGDLFYSEIRNYTEESTKVWPV